MSETTKAPEAVAKKPRAKKAAAAAEAAPVAVAAVEAAPAKKPRATKAKAAESGEAKPAAKPRKAAKKAEKQQVTPEQRHEMVSMAAYFIAERRGFLTGYEHEDWLAAEREIDIRIELI